jgi:type IV fimbrial biogenesis protein FimT
LRGFTIIELMVTVAVIAVLAAIAAPSFNPLIERWRVRQITEELQSTLYFARSEAIKRGGGITIDATGGWDQGWKVTHTQAGDLQFFTAPSKVVLTQNNSKPKIFVDRWGMLSEINGGAATAMNFLLYPTDKNDNDHNAIRLCVSSGGRILQKSAGAACPS